MQSLYIQVSLSVSKYLLQAVRVRTLDYSHQYCEQAVKAGSLDYAFHLYYQMITPLLQQSHWNHSPKIIFQVIFFFSFTKDFTFSGLSNATKEHKLP